MYSIFPDDYDPPKFTLLTPAQILARQEAVVEDPERPHQWSLYGLHLYRDPIAKGCKRCPKTAAVLAQIPGLINAGFSCLGPHSETGWHEDVDRGFDRLHLSLIIPEGDCGFTVGSATQRWKNKSTIAFDDTFLHNAWNKTALARYVLLVDVERNPKRAEIMAMREQHPSFSHHQNHQNHDHPHHSHEARSIDQKFHDWQQTFPCLESILQNLQAVQQEWDTVVDSPETIDSPEETYDQTQDQSWKNFWLCHTFPAHRPELTTWIGNNCKLVPRTAALLQKIPGIRDAFFSQLGPGVVLDEHYGYADQSNWILRCHIPLVLPDNVQSCYIEVEGERRFHTMQDIIVFDDSKLHSAGNLSTNQSRTVLIIDIDRPNHVQLGTSRSCISRTMLSHWSSKVYPHFDEEAIRGLVEARVPFCNSFLDEGEEF